MSLGIHALALLLVMYLSGRTILPVAAGEMPKRTAVSLLFHSRPAPAVRTAVSRPRPRPNFAPPNLVKATGAPPPEVLPAPPALAPAAVPLKMTLPRLNFEAPPRPAPDSSGFAGAAVPSVPANAVHGPSVPANTFGGIHVEQRSSIPPDSAKSHHAFAAATVSAGERKAPVNLPPTALRRAVEILYKPEPGYTPAARERGIEGEVWLAVVFGRDAKLTVQRVVRGLGFGLDESAIASAGAVRFRPAEENGVPVDLEAVLRVRFSLAR